MKKTALLRFKALLAIAATALTTAEASELQVLTKSAKAANIEPEGVDAAIATAEDDTGGEMSEDEVKETVTKAVKAALADHKSASTEEVSDAVMAKMKALGNQGLTEDKVRSIMADVLKENTKTASKMEFPTDGGHVSFPVEHRAGNLSVAQKQLLNTCLMKVSDSALAELSTKRPRDINDGLTEDTIRRTKSVSDGVTSRMRQGAKGLTTTGSGSGAELVYTDLATDLQQRLYLKSELAQVLMARELNMPTDPFKLPIKTVRTQFAAGSESPTPGSLAAYLHYNNPTLANITLDAKKIIGIGSYSYEANEDAIIAILPMLQNDLGDGAVAAYEDAIINGDAGAASAHQDYIATAYPSADSVKLLFDGIRKAGIATGVLDWSTGGVSKSNFMAARAAMGKWGTNPSDLAIVVSPYGFVQLQAIEEAFSAFHRGGAADASVNTGLINSFNGIRVIVSEQMPTGVKADGMYSGNDNSGTNTYESLLLTNLTQWIVGVRRGFTVEVTSDPLIQTNYVVASFRRAFVPKEVASASIPHTVLATKWG